MKKVKFFFGAACLLIAAGSAYATNVLGDVPADYKFYISNGTNICAVIPVTTCTQPPTNWPCLYDQTATIKYPVYDHAQLVNNVLVCSDRLYYQTEP